MASDADRQAIERQYRAYCDACESDQLSKVPSYWSLPALFAVDEGGPQPIVKVLTTADEMIQLYGTLFNATTGINKTLIDSQEVTFYGDRLATIKTSLRHMAGDVLHDNQYALYEARKIDDVWLFFSHLSLDTVPSK